VLVRELLVRAVCGLKLYIQSSFIITNQNKAETVFNRERSIPTVETLSESSADMFSTS